MEAALTADVIESWFRGLRCWVRAEVSDASDVSGLTEIAEAWAHELPGLDLKPFLLSAGIMRLAQRIERAFAAIARSSGIGPGDLRILLALRRSAPDYTLSPTALFTSLMITSGAVTKQVDRLVEVGLVERARDPDTLRGLLIRLLPAGRTVAEDAMTRISSSFCGLETLGDEHSTEALHVLSRLQRTVDDAG